MARAGGGPLPAGTAAAALPWAVSMPVQLPILRPGPALPGLGVDSALAAGVQTSCLIHAVSNRATYLSTAQAAELYSPPARYDRA